MSLTPQLTLAVQLPDDETFDSFQLGDNSVCIEQLKSFISTPQTIEIPSSFYLFGVEGSGKSHLIHAACSYAEQINQSTFCISLSQLSELSVEVLEGLEHYELVCLDDIQSIANNSLWQQAVFDLFNRLFEHNHKVIITGNTNVKSLNMTLPDLTSRLAWGETQSLKVLSDQEKLTAIKSHAIQRGMQLSNEVVKFLINRQARDMGSLIDSLNLLDEASIREQRKITIPFIKDILFNTEQV